MNSKDERIVLDGKLKHNINKPLKKFKYLTF